jgi:16S rRNA processing protein RimM
LKRSVDKKDHVLIGEIVGVHGLKGTSKIRSYADSLSLFKPGRSILVRESGGQEKSREIQWIKPHTGTALISFKGIIERYQAQALVGAELFVPKEELPELEEDSHFWFDLIGMAVYTIEGNYLGRIESIIETGSNDVYVVQDDKKEVLIPALESVVLDIDIKDKRMQVDLPEGLV